MASAEAAPMCRCLVGLAGRKLATCLDTGATFSLLSTRVYQELRPHLPSLDSSDLVLTGAGGESLDVEGMCTIQFKLGGITYEQTVQVGRLEGLDLLLGMDWLVTHKAEINCGRRTIWLKENPEVSFGRILAVDSKELVRMDKTICIRPRGMQQVSCHVRNLSKAGREVLIEGVFQLGGTWYLSRR